jgi:hypothetical protein
MKRKMAELQKKQEYSEVLREEVAQRGKMRELDNILQA